MLDNYENDEVGYFLENVETGDNMEFNDLDKALVMLENLKILNTDNQFRIWTKRDFKMYKNFCEPIFVKLKYCTSESDKNFSVFKNDYANIHCTVINKTWRDYHIGLDKLIHDYNQTFLKNKIEQLKTEEVS